VCSYKVRCPASFKDVVFRQKVRPAWTKDERFNMLLSHPGGEVSFTNVMFQGGFQGLNCVGEAESDLVCLVKLTRCMIEASRDVGLTVQDDITIHLHDTNFEKIATSALWLRHNAESKLCGVSVTDFNLKSSPIAVGIYDDTAGPSELKNCTVETQAVGVGLKIDAPRNHIGSVAPYQRLLEQCEIPSRQIVNFDQPGQARLDLKLVGGPVVEWRNRQAVETFLNERCSQGRPNAEEEKEEGQQRRGTRTRTRTRN